MLLSKSFELPVSHLSKHVTFNLHPPRSSYKVLFQGTELGDALKRISLTKAVPEGFERRECEHGIGGKISLLCYILEQDPIQEALEMKHQPTSFKLSLPSGSEIRMVRWASMTLKHCSRSCERGNPCH